MDTYVVPYGPTPALPLWGREFFGEASRGARYQKKPSCLAARNGEGGDGEGRHVGAITEFQIIRRHECFKHVAQVAGDRHFADGVGFFAALKPEAARTDREITREQIGPVADGFGDIKPIAECCE